MKTQKKNQWKHVTFDCDYRLKKYAKNVIDFRGKNHKSEKRVELRSTSTPSHTCTPNAKPS